MPTDNKKYFHAWRSLFGKITFPILTIGCIVVIIIAIVINDYVILVIFSVFALIFVGGFIISFFAAKHDWYSDWGIGNDKTGIMIKWEDIFISVRIIEKVDEMLLHFYFNTHFLSLENKEDENERGIQLTNKHLNFILQKYRREFVFFDLAPNAKIRYRQLKILIAHNLTIQNVNYSDTYIQ